MKDKICMVTGANSGIGLATAIGLAKQGASVVLVSRSAQRGEQALKDIISITGNKSVELLVADLSKQQDIRRLASQFEEKYDRLDVLVNNAGGIFDDSQASADGYEMTFAVNYLAPFLLTNLLIPRLQASGAGRVVNVASIMQAKKLKLDVIGKPGNSTGMTAYKEAKTAVLLMTYLMAEQLSDSGVTVNALHPGVIYTPQSTKSVPAFAQPLLKLFMRSPEQGAITSLYLATSPEVEQVSGNYYKGTQAAPTVPITYNVELQKELFRRSKEWTSM